MTGRSPRVVLVVEQLRRAVPGGIGRYVNGLLQGLTDLRDGGEDIPEVILYASRPPAGADPLDRFGLKVISSVLPGPFLTRAWDRGLVKAPGHGDVVHALSLAAPPPGSAPLVVTVHDVAWRRVPETFPPRGRRWHEAAFGRSRRRAARLVVPSDSTACDVAEAGADPGSIVVIAHGSDHLPAPDDKGATTLLQRLGVEGDFLLSVGTLEPRKNLVRLSDAYGRVRPKLPTPMPLVVVGPEGWTGSRAPGAHGDTSAPGPDAPGVIATGPVDDAILAALYGRARLLVYVPLTEGFGFPPVEAMRIGTPVVSSPMPSLGGAGLVVDPQNLEEIGTAILRAATDEALRSELVAGGFERAKQLTWAASARRHVDLWESLR